MAKRRRLLSRQKVVEEGMPTRCLSFHGDVKARICISGSEATACHDLHTHEARARSVSGSRSKMHLRMSPDARAEKLEFNGEMMEVPASEFLAVVAPSSEMRRCLRISSSSSPQHPITLNETFACKVYVREGEEERVCCWEFLTRDIGISYLDLALLVLQKEGYEN